ncbi:MAG: DUF1294 domain-containing protein [Puniceicoccaceae bacterium]
MIKKRHYINYLLPAGLLILPAIALYRSGWDLRWIGAYILVVNGVTFLTYRRDKLRAGTGEWRVPERRLHLLELLGGWPAAWLAREVLRHKSAKLSFRIVSWMIVGAYQLLSLDALLGWPVMEGLVDSIDLILKSRGS